MLFEGTKLPDTYKGYSTQELLDMWKAIQGDGITKGTSVEKIVAMRNLIWDFRLSGEAQAVYEAEEEERQRKQEMEKNNGATTEGQ